MADPLERLTNLVALLLETRQPLTLEQIADALAGQYPEGAAARHGAFERDKAMLREGGVPLETRCWPATPPAPPATSSTGTATSSASISRRRRPVPCRLRWRPCTSAPTGAPTPS